MCRCECTLYSNNLSSAQVEAEPTCWPYFALKGAYFEKTLECQQVPPKHTHLLRDNYTRAASKRCLQVPGHIVDISRRPTWKTLKALAERDSGDPSKTAVGAHNRPGQERIAESNVLLSGCSNAEC